MRPEDWRNLRHLLLLFFLEERDELSPFLSIANLLFATLSTTNIHLLVLKDKQYGFCPLHHEIKIEFFDLLLMPYQTHVHLVNQIKELSFNASIVLTTPRQSPFSLAYLCYLAGIPVRLGQSQEFGGGVLSHCIQPPLEAVSVIDYNLHLLRSAGFPGLVDSKISIG